MTAHILRGAARDILGLKKLNIWTAIFESRGPVNNYDHRLTSQNQVAELTEEHQEQNYVILGKLAEKERES